MCERPERISWRKAGAVNSVGNAAIRREDEEFRRMLVEAGDAHLEDLDAGGYPDASATELWDAPNKYVPIARQVLWASRAVRL
jgi:hypothetical protein